MSEILRTIVVGMDGSDFSVHALEWFMKQIHRPGDYVVLIHCPEYHGLTQSLVRQVTATFVYSELGSVAEQLEEAQEKDRIFIQSLEDKMVAAHIDGKVKCKHGYPGDAIIKAAEEENACLIVTGSRGQSTIRRTLVGSISDYVLHHSHIPVVICRHHPVL